MFLQKVDGHFRHPLLLAALFFAFCGPLFSQDVIVEKPPVTQQDPLTVGIVVDNSGSLRLVFDRVVSSVDQIIDDMQPGDEGFLVTFVDTPKIALRQEMTSERSGLKDAAENMFVEAGQTAMLDAIAFAAKYMAAQAKPEAGRERILIVITDGDERVSSATLEEAVSTAKAARARVFVLGLYDEKFYAKTVDRVVRETGGAKFVPKIPKDTAAAIAGLLKAIRSR